jgi:hypothetical protein
MDEDDDPIVVKAFDSNNDAAKGKRPYTPPAIECYGSVSGVTQFIAGNYKGRDTLLYSY